MKASDIADKVFLDIVREFNHGRQPPGSRWGDGPRWAHEDDLTDRLGLPYKVIRAKADKLIRRGLMDGCSCGCRGDYDYCYGGYPDTHEDKCATHSEKVG